MDAISRNDFETRLLWFLTAKKWLRLDPARLNITVFLNDDEAYDIGNDEVQIPANQIRREGEDENSWPAG